MSICHLKTTDICLPKWQNLLKSGKHFQMPLCQSFFGQHWTNMIRTDLTCLIRSTISQCLNTILINLQKAF